MSDEDTLQPAEHRATGLDTFPELYPPKALPLPTRTMSLSRANQDLAEFGMCLLENALSPQEIADLGARLENQAKAERELGPLAPPSAAGVQQLVSNLVNKGWAFLDLVARPQVDALVSPLLGNDFLISSITGGLFHSATNEPQILHRDQGQVPASAGIPAAVNLFWLLDDFTPERGSTWVVPGSHRWPSEYQIKPPPRDFATQITAPAGTLFAWDGRIWHGAGANQAGHRRAHIATFFCLPWMRQQENWGISCLQEVLDEASDHLKVRLGLKTYGTLGGVNGTAASAGVAGTIRQPLGNNMVHLPEYIIGEAGALHPLRRVSRHTKANAE